LGLDLGARGGNVSFPIGEPSVVDVAGVSSGPDGLRLLCLPSSDELLVAGGIQQRRAITAHSNAAQEVTVAPRFVWDSAEGSGRTFLRASARDDELGQASEGASPKSVRSSLEVEPLVLG